MIRGAYQLEEAVGRGEKIGPLSSVFSLHPIFPQATFDFNMPLSKWSVLKSTKNAHPSPLPLLASLASPSITATDIKTTTIAVIASATIAAALPSQITVTTTVAVAALSSSSSTTVTQKKRQQVLSTSSSKDKINIKSKTARDVKRVKTCAGWTRRSRNKLQPQQLMDLKILHNFKEVDGKGVEYPSNFPEARVLSIMRTNRESEGIISMIGEATPSLGPLSVLVTGELMKSVAGTVPIYMHPSLYRTFRGSRS